MNMSLEDRQMTAISVAAFLAFGVPLLVGLPLLMVTAWLNVIGDHHVHQQVWGWLSTFHRYPSTGAHKGHTDAGVGSLPILYWLSVPTTYALYQFTELLAAVLRGFKHALVGA